MANIRIIKNRIKSTKSIAQITKAMELVAASKMRKAQLAALSGKLYANKIRDMVRSLATRTDLSAHPLLSEPSKLATRRLVIVISSNKGMCGGLNTALFKTMLQQYPDTKRCVFVSLGRKGANFISKTDGELKADFSATIPFVSSVSALTDLLTGEFIAGNVTGVDIVYNEFITVLKQNPVVKSILPIRMDEIEAKNSEDTGEFLIEPSVGGVLEVLLPHYIENQVRDAVLQAEASEQSARMVAMRNATDNALSFMDDLTLLYNKARQEKITYEISDMVTARLATE